MYILLGISVSRRRSISCGSKSFRPSTLGGLGIAPCMALPPRAHAGARTEKPPAINIRIAAATTVPGRLTFWDMWLTPGEHVWRDGHERNPRISEITCRSREVQG